MMEIVEYRPGKWVKVLDGRIVGRATADEVAAWQAQAGSGDLEQDAPLDIDLDLDLHTASAGSPAHSLDVPLRPAFERRRLRPEPHPGEGASRLRPPRTQVDEDIKDLTVETAMAREASARRKSERTAPQAEAPGEPVMVRRRLPAVGLPVSPPAKETTGEETTLPRKARPTKDRPSEETQPATRPSRPAKQQSAAPEEEPSKGRKAATGGRSKPARKAPAAPQEETAKAQKAPARRRAEPRAEVPAPQAESAQPAKERARRQARPRKTAPAPGQEEATAAEAPAEEQAQPAAEAESATPRYWWIYNAHRQPAEAFLREWMPKYQEKYGLAPTLILCHEDDLAAAEASGLEAEVSPLLQPGNFYLGHEDGRE